VARQISEKAARDSSEEYLRRLAAYVGIEEPDKKNKEEIIYYLQCQLIVGTKSRPGWG